MARGAFDSETYSSPDGQSTLIVFTVLVSTGTKARTSGSVPSNSGLDIRNRHSGRLGPARWSITYSARTKLRMSFPPPVRPATQPHQLTPDAERQALSFLTGDGNERTLHMSALNCALMSQGCRVHERLKWLYEGTAGMGDPVESIDTLIALLTTERVRALDCAAVRAKMEAEGKPLRTRPYEPPPLSSYSR